MTLTVHLFELAQLRNYPGFSRCMKPERFSQIDPISESRSNVKHKDCVLLTSQTPRAPRQYFGA